MRWLYGSRLAVLALALFAAGVALAPGADPVPTENPVPAHSFGEVKYALAEREEVLWEVTPEPTIVKEYIEYAPALDKDGKPLPPAPATAVIHFNGPAGDYTVRAFVADFKGGKKLIKKVTVTLDGSAPDPGPNPNPGPKPKPQPDPTGTPKGFVVVEDTTKAGAWRGDVLGSPKLASWYRAAFGPGVHHLLLDAGAEGDATAQAWVKLAAGKQLPYLFVTDETGRVLKALTCPTDSADSFIAAFDVHSGPRAMGALLEEPKLKWTVFGESPTTPLIPRDKWKPVDLSAYLPPVYDQNGKGQCASSSACSVYEWARALAGLPYVHVSAGDLYSRVNGGSDRGSTPEDNLRELIDNGVAPAEKVPYVWNGRRYTDAATVTARKSHRIAEAFRCDSFDSLASALQQGFATQIAMWWFNNDTPDANGVLPKQGRGGKGGHALMSYGLVKLPDGSWALLVRNSWGAGWGNSKDGKIGPGNCVIPESRISFQFGSVWAVRAAVNTGSNFPAPKLAAIEPKREPLALFPEREPVVLKP